jgi:hypothetical protein
MLKNMQKVIQKIRVGIHHSRIFIIIYVWCLSGTRGTKETIYMYEGSSSQLNYSNVHQILDTSSKDIWKSTVHSSILSISNFTNQSSVKITSAAPPNEISYQASTHYAKVKLRLHIHGSTLWLCHSRMPWAKKFIQIMQLKPEQDWLFPHLFLQLQLH